MMRLRKTITFLVIVILVASFSPVGFAISNSASISKPYISGLTPINAVLNANVTWTGTKLSQVGFCLGKSMSGMVRVGYDTVLPNLSSFKFWYDLNSECKVKLVPNTTYYCRPYVIQAGKTVFGTIISFKTPAISVSFTSTKASGISSTKARIESTITSNIKPSKVGMYLEYGSTRRVVGYDTTIPNQKSFPFWYDLTSLTAKTKYTMQPFAVLNGSTYYGAKVSFTTSASTTSTSVPCPSTPQDLFINHLVWNGCSVGATANMFRLYSFMHGSTSYKGITYWTIHNALVSQFGNYGWSSGFRYDGKTLGYQSLTGYSNTDKKNYLINKVRERQKNGGVFIYARTPKNPHAILLIGYNASNGELMCVDSGLNGIAGGYTYARTLSSSLLGTASYGYTATAIIGYITDALWIN